MQKPKVNLISDSVMLSFITGLICLFTRGDVLLLLNFFSVTVIQRSVLDFDSWQELGAVHCTSGF